MTKTALVAIGGNSLILDPKNPDVPHQWDAVRETVRHLADMVQDGWNLIITHGNGPQVGYILRRNELASHEVHPTPLDLIVADTQGSIGYMLQQALCNEMISRHDPREVVTVVTQVLVDSNDPAFQKPNKPVGSFMEEAKAREFEAQGWSVMEDAGRGWRRVVASPQPLRVVEENSVRALINAGNIVIAAGGGGIPVVENHKGELRELKGVYAVIDKDRASALLSKSLKIDLFMISTGVDQVSVNYNKPNQSNLADVSVSELEQYMAEGHFAPGSMKPKVEAVIDYVKATGGQALITSPFNIARALKKESGTWVHL